MPHPDLNHPIGAGSRFCSRSLPRVLVALALLTTPVAAEPESPAQEAPLVLEARPVEGVVPPVLEAPRGDYRIGRQDLLEIKVFDVDELNQTVRVADDGSITMPLLGRLDVRGLSKTQLEQMIATMLGERYVHDPQVTVFVKDYESKKVAVSGAVKRPGSYEMLGRKTLLEMMSLAGGLDRDMGKEIIIFRQENGETRRIAVELEQLVYAADPSLNLVVEPGDIIYIPTVERVRIFVTGAVRNPDLYEVPREEPVTVLKAVTLAGGTTDRAAQKRVQVIRTDEKGNRITLLVNLKKIKRGKAEDPILHRDDVVLVPESFF
jgi:polysaccharide export outer membrane protein